MSSTNNSTSRSWTRRRLRRPCGFSSAGNPMVEVPIAEVLDSLVVAVAERNSDFYEYVDGRLHSAG